MEFPEKLKYTKEHTWISVDESIGTVGISEFAQSELGEIVYVDVPDNGSLFKQDTVFGSVEALKTVSDLFMPMSGKVIESNKNLLQEPTLVNSDPYETGWMIKIEIENQDELNNLLSSDAYAKIVN